MGDLGGGVDAGDIGVTGGAGGDEGGFGDEEGAGNGDPLGVVFGGDGELDVGSSARKRVRGAMMRRCWRCRLPMRRGSASDGIVTEMRLYRLWMKQEWDE